ncbi:MAG: MCE family protein [Proteobacteria bacterium]|nr:MCE family protein [Pseudomonadota bacterium]
MEGRGTFLRVGVLIVAGIVALGAMVWFFGGDQLRHGVPFETYFRESVQGLEVGAPVKFRGVTLGRVTEIGLVSAEYARNEPVPLGRDSFLLVFVRFILDPTRIGRLPDNKVAVERGLRARLASQGLTGVTYIELDFVNPLLYPPIPISWEPKVDYIPSMPSTLMQVQDAAQQVLTKLNNLDLATTLRDLDGLLVDLRTALQRGDVHDTLSRAQTLLTTLNNAVNGADVPGLAANLRATSDSARTVLQNPDIKRLLANAADAADRLSDITRKMQPLIATLQNTTGRADSSLADIQRALGPMLRDLSATAANLRETTDTLRRYPSQLLLGGPPPRAPAEAGR